MGLDLRGHHRPVRRRRRRRSRCSCGGRPRPPRRCSPSTCCASGRSPPPTPPILFIGLAMGGTFLMVVIFLVSVLGYTELRAALALTVMPIVALIVAPNAGRLNDRIGPRFPAAVGAACFGVGLILLAQLGGDTTLVDVMWRVVFLGLGMGLAMPTLSAASMASLPPQVRGVGSGSLNTMRQIGFTVGVALVVAIFSHTVAQNAQHATRQAAGVIAAQPAAQQGREGRLRRHPDQERQGGRRQRRRGGADDHRPAQGSSAACRAPSRRPWPSSTPSSRPSTRTTSPGRSPGRSTPPRWRRFIAIIPALLTGKRLGEHEGHQEMSREERLAAAGRAEAAEAGEPLTDATAWERRGRAADRRGEMAPSAQERPPARRVVGARRHPGGRARRRSPSSATTARRSAASPRAPAWTRRSSSTTSAPRTRCSPRRCSSRCEPRRGVHAGRGRRRRGSIGETVVRTFLEAWEPPEQRVRLDGHAALGDDQRDGHAASCASSSCREVFAPDDRRCSACPTRELRATLVGSQFVGLALMRYVGAHRAAGLGEHRRAGRGHRADGAAVPDRRRSGRRAGCGRPARGAAGRRRAAPAGLR